MAVKKKTRTTAVKKSAPAKKAGTDVKTKSKKTSVKPGKTSGTRKKTLKSKATGILSKKTVKGKLRKTPAGTAAKKETGVQKATRAKKTKTLLDSIAAIQPEIKKLKTEKPKLSPEKEAAYKLAQRVGQLMLDKKAERVSILDVGKLTGVMDYFVIATGMADVHIKAIADHVIDELYKDGEAPHHVEGTEAYRWVLIDYIDVVAHIFENETRSFYDLERLWGDAEVIPVEDRG